MQNKFIKKNYGTIKRTSANVLFGYLYGCSMVVYLYFINETHIITLSTALPMNLVLFIHFSWDPLIVVAVAVPLAVVVFFFLLVVKISFGRPFISLLVHSSSAVSTHLS